VPTDMTNYKAVYDNLLFRVDLTVRSNCMTATGPQSTVVTAYIQVSCSVPTVTPSNFMFYTPYVNTYSSNPQNFWGFSTTTPQFITVKNPATLAPASTFNPANLYYRANMALKITASATGSTVGAGSPPLRPHWSLLRPQPVCGLWIHAHHPLCWLCSSG